MTREEKNQVIEELQGILTEKKVIYLTDASNLNSADTTRLRGECYKKDIKMRVVKNTLLRIAMDRVEDRDFSELYDVMSGQTALMVGEVGNMPAKLIKELRRSNDRPLLKGAFVAESVFVGDDQLTALSELKSKDELIGDIIGLLQSPMSNVLGALQSGGNTVSGLVKALSERKE
jgi:large subunit ribosomal protein L10